MISVEAWRAAIGCFCPKALSQPIATGEQGADVVLALVHVLMIHIVFHVRMACRTSYTFMKALYFFVRVAYYYAIWTCYVCCAYCIRHPLTVYQVYMYLMSGRVDASPQVSVLCLKYTADDDYTCLVAVVSMCVLAVDVCRKVYRVCYTFLFVLLLTCVYEQYYCCVMEWYAVMNMYCGLCATLCIGYACTTCCC